PPAPHPVSLLEAPGHQSAHAALDVCRRGYLSVDALLTNLRPQPIRHTLPPAVLPCLDVMEVRHLLVEDGVADGPGRVLGNQNDNTLSLDETGVEAATRGPGGR